LHFSISGQVENRHTMLVLVCSRIGRIEATNAVYWHLREPPDSKNSLELKLRSWEFFRVGLPKFHPQDLLGRMNQGDPSQPWFVETAGDFGPRARC